MAKKISKGTTSGAKKVIKPAATKAKPIAAKGKPSKPAPAKKDAKTVKPAAAGKGAKPAAKPAPKPAATSKGAQAKPKSPPSVKKPASKSAKKTAPAAKPATKPAAKAPAKPAAKAVSKAPAKPAEKPAAKTAPATKPAAKAAPAPVPTPTPAPAPVKAAAPSKSSSSPKNGKSAAAQSVLPPPVAPLRVSKPVVDELTIEVKAGPVKMTPFLKKQKQRLMDLRSSLSESMEGMAAETIRSRPEGSDASVGGMHMGDAGSDAYDRDFALSLLSKEQDALYEIHEALKRIDLGTYGICELSGKKINEERLEALPFTRYTREMQEQVERDQFGGKNRRVPVRSVFGLEGDDEDEEGEDEEAPASNTQQSESSLDFMKE
jgi:RNA polymerase-binding transcription factor DksA